MSDIVAVLSMMGLLKPIIAMIVAFAAIAIYFGFIKKA